MPFSFGEFHTDAVRFLLLPAALVLDAVIGEAGPVFRLLPHPVVLVGRLIGRLDAALNDPSRSPRGRLLRGAAAVAAVVAAAAGAGYGVALLARALPQGWVFELAAVVSLLAQRDLFDRVRAVSGALGREGLDGGRRAVAHVVGRDPASLDAAGVARAAIESLAENFADAVVAPCFWYLLLGLPGLAAYKAINTLDSMIGHRTPRHAAFGAVAARLDDAANWAPARLAGVLVAAAAAPVPGCRPSAAFRVMLRDAGRHRSVNAGWPESAMAGAVGVALAGPRRYGGVVVDDAWLGGDFGAGAAPADIRRALHVFVVACMLNLAVVAGIGILVQAPWPAPAGA